MSDSNAKTPVQEALSPAIELMRKATEQAVNEAMEDQFLSFLEDCVSGSGSPRRGYYERKVLTTVGEINVRVPRDRLSLFEERVIGRYRRRADDLGAEIGTHYAQGISSSDISQYLSAKSGVEVSEKLVLAIVKGSYGEAERFNSRKLPKCAFVYLDGTWLPVRRRYGDGPDRYEKECVMVALGITESGRKEVLGFWIGPSESAEGWENALKASGKGGSGAHNVHHGRAAGDAGGHKAGIPRILPPKVPCPRREEHVLRGEEEGQAGHIGRFQIGLFGRIGGGGEGPAGPIRGEVVANLPIVQEVPDRAGAFLVLPLPQGSLEAPLHLKRGRGLPRLPQKEAEGQAGPPFPQERVLPHSRRGGEIQQIRQEQEADRLR